MPRRRAVLQLSLALAWFGSSACNARLDTSLDRKECSRSGECLAGYECSPDRVCVRVGSQNEQPTTSAPDARTADAAPAQESGVAVGMPLPPSCDGSFCDGVCADLNHDIDNCGACGRQCPGTANGRPVCDEGRCGIGCDDQYTSCGDACFLLASDPRHCGDCTAVCSAPINGQAVCADSRCSRMCDPGFVACGEACTRLETDPVNCGTCGTTCAADEQCAGGTCVKACPAGTQECARSCVDVLADTQNCGVCANACTAPRGSTALCQQGVCAWQCTLGLQQCSGACIDTQNDPANCGGCGQACPAAPARGTATCQSGACAVECSDDYTNCDGQCISPQLVAAARQAGFGSMPPCAALAAYQNYLMCQGMGENVMYCGGQCVNVANSREHCGGCGRACRQNQSCYRMQCVQTSF